MRKIVGILTLGTILGCADNPAPSIEKSRVEPHIEERRTGGEHQFYKLKIIRPPSIDEKINVYSPPKIKYSLQIITPWENRRNFVELE